MDSHNFLGNFTTNGNPLAEKPSIASLATAFLSFARFQGWLKLFLLSVTFEICQRLHIWGNIIDLFWFTTVNLEEDNCCLGECSPAVMTPSPAADHALFLQTGCCCGSCNIHGWKQPGDLSSVIRRPGWDLRIMLNGKTVGTLVTS